MLGSSDLPVIVFEAAWHGAQAACDKASNAEDKDDGNMSTLKSWHGFRLPDFVGLKNTEWESFRLSEAVHLLLSLSLITKSIRSGMTFLSMHPVTHVWAKERQEDKVKLSQVWVSVGCLIALSDLTSEVWQRYEKEMRPHLHAYLHSIVWDDVHAAYSLMIIRILYRCGVLLNQMRDDSQLPMLVSRMFKELKFEFQVPDLNSSALHSLAASNLLNSGKVGRAVKVLEHVVEVREEKLAEDHSSRLTSQHELAIAYRSNGQVDKAVKLLEHIVKVEESKLAEDHPSRLASQHELAIVYRSNGQVDKAIKLLEHVVKIREEKLAEDHSSRLASQHALAAAYWSNDQVNSAVKLLEHVVKFQEEKLAEDHPNRLISQHALAIAYESNGQMNKAVKLLEHVVKVQEEKLD